MKRYIVFLLVGACLFAVAGDPPTAMAQTAYVWDNQVSGEPAEDRSWCNEDNWNPTGVPGGAAGDSATIGELPEGEGYAYPIFDCDDPITIASLTIVPPSEADSDVELTFEHADDPRVLIITDRDGFNTNDYSDVLMQKNAVLRLDGGGVAVLDGTIRFENGGTAKPEFVLGDGTNLTIGHEFGSRATFVGVSRGLITGQVGSPDDAEVLVLTSQVRMCGNFDIDVILVNNGRVSTSIDWEESEPNARATPGTINLVCHPKGGCGYWLVDGGVKVMEGEAEVIYESKLNIDTGMASSGNLLIWRYGWAIAERPVSLVRDVGFSQSGHLLVRPGGTLRVQKNLAFDAHRWDCGCPEVSFEE